MLQHQVHCRSQKGWRECERAYLEVESGFSKGIIVKHDAACMSDTFGYASAYHGQAVRPCAIAEALGGLNDGCCPKKGDEEGVGRDARPVSVDGFADRTGLFRAIHCEYLLAGCLWKEVNLA